jgi:Tfp pilus assembly protein PilN
MRFQINIYRPGAKPKKVPKPRGEERRISVAILIPLMFLLLLGISFAYMRASSSVDRRMKMNRHQKAYWYGQLEETEKELKKAKEERDRSSKLHVKRVEWFHKLVDLSEIMPDDLWLTDLSLKTVEKRKKGSREVEVETLLIIKGATVPVLGQERADSIAQLISSLNSLDSFQRDFEPATLVKYTHLSRGKERELMQFEISAKLKGVPGVSGGKASK